jgi:predicted RNA-binding protein with RPS1 domain
MTPESIDLLKKYHQKTQAALTELDNTMHNLIKLGIKDFADNPEYKSRLKKWKKATKEYVGLAALLSELDKSYGTV